MSASAINTMMEEQNAVFIDRATEIKAAWLAALSSEHVFFLGKPGTAKSMLSRDMTRRFTGARGFEFLFRKDSTSQELFGPQSIKALRDDRLEYVVDGFLPTAHFPFLDEIWKASSAALNNLLTILNERMFDNGNTRIKVPLISAFSASNELPQGKELGALYDRFLFRYVVTGLEDDADFYELLSREPKLNVKTTISLEDFQKIQAEAMGISLPEDVLHKVVDLRRALSIEGVWASERRWLQGLKAVRAHAYINERTDATEDDLEIFEHLLWDTLEQRPVVRKVVLTTINPLNQRLLELYDNATTEFQRFKDELDRGGDDVSAIALEAHNNLNRAKQEIIEIVKQSSGSMRDRAKEYGRQVRDQVKYIAEKGFGYEGEDELG